MSDEDLRREERLARAGAPSVRRVIELDRLASALRAVLPTREEERAWGRVVPSLLTWFPTASVEAIVITRRVLREQAERDPLVHEIMYGGPSLLRGSILPDYGPPSWLEDYARARRFANERPEQSLREMIASRTPFSIGGHVRPRFFSGTVLPERRTSDPTCAPAASALAIDQALAEFPPSRRRRHR